MEFEFDKDKSLANRAKYGLDFVEAQALWSDDRLLEIQARTDDEPRFLLVGRIAGVFWSAIITYRSCRIRLISVRRSRPEEVVLHEGKAL